MRILTPTYELTKAQFVARLIAILGDVRYLWMPAFGDTTVNDTLENEVGRVVTYDASVASRLSVLGNGAAQSFSSAGSQYGTTPDTANLSFTTLGLTDLPFTLVVLANVTNTVAERSLLSKWNPTGSLREWFFTIDAGDTMTLFMRDESAAVTISRASNAAITQGSWRLFSVTYDGTGGATAANGVTLYQDAAAIASTATNNAAYVAMEDLTAACELGSRSAHTASFLDGSLAMAIIAAGVTAAPKQLTLKTLVNQFFQLAL